MADPGWALEGEEVALIRYVLPDEVGQYVRIPEASDEDRLTRFRTIYSALKGIGIQYAGPMPHPQPGRQPIRPPDHILWYPRNGTCLDLAVTFSAACIHAGLHPIIVLVEPQDNSTVDHALVLVRLDMEICGRTDGNFRQDVWWTPPQEILGDLQRHPGGPNRNIIPVDPVGIASSQGTSRAFGLDVNLTTAVSNAAGYLLGDEHRAPWKWRFAVDIGSAWYRSPPDSVRSMPRPQRAKGSSRVPTRLQNDIFVSDDAPRNGPLSRAALLREQNMIVSFDGRDDEIHELREWCNEAGKIRCLVITGAGGQGKSRLVRELIREMRDAGWDAGWVRREDPATVLNFDAISDFKKPTLLAVDYAETRGSQLHRLLGKIVLLQPPSRLRLIMIARSAESDRGWWSRIQRSHPIALDSATSIPLGSLAMANDERTKEFNRARDCFAVALAKVSQP